MPSILPRSSECLGGAGTLRHWSVEESRSRPDFHCRHICWESTRPLFASSPDKASMRRRRLVSYQCDIGRAKHCAAQQETPHLVPSVIEDITVPVLVNSLARIRVLV